MLDPSQPLSALHAARAVGFAESGCVSGTEWEERRRCSGQSDSITRPRTSSFRPSCRPP